MTDATTYDMQPRLWRSLFRWVIDIARGWKGELTTHQCEDRAISRAKPFGKVRPVRKFFWRHVRRGFHPVLAATWALDEWEL